MQGKKVSCKTKTSTGTCTLHLFQFQPQHFLKNTQVKSTWNTFAKLQKPIIFVQQNPIGMKTNSALIFFNTKVAFAFAAFAEQNKNPLSFTKNNYSAYYYISNGVSNLNYGSSDGRLLSSKYNFKASELRLELQKLGLELQKLRLELQKLSFELQKLSLKLKNCQFATKTQCLIVNSYK